MGVGFQEFLDEWGPLGSLRRSYPGLHAGAMRVVVGIDVCLLCKQWSGIMDDERREVEGKKCVQFDVGRVTCFE